MRLLPPSVLLQCVLSLRCCFYFLRVASRRKTMEGDEDDGGGVWRLAAEREIEGSGRRGWRERKMMAARCGGWRRARC
ncbi:unnamed protein product [Linum trigynum]|uniref:Secreted protein n=1 Tax=Linum trigynum TaxID=586398 RepID=A0AAV2GM18_9ROSI